MLQELLPPFFKFQDLGDPEPKSENTCSPDPSLRSQSTSPTGLRQDSHRSVFRLRSSTVMPFEMSLRFGRLTYFPAAHSEKEAHQVRLLLLLKFLDILEGTHLGWKMGKTTVSVTIFFV